MAQFRLFLLLLAVFSLGLCQPIPQCDCSDCPDSLTIPAGGSDTVDFNCGAGQKVCFDKITVASQNSTIVVCVRAHGESDCMTLPNEIEEESCYTGQAGCAETSVHVDVVCNSSSPCEVDYIILNPQCQGIYHWSPDTWGICSDQCIEEPESYVCLDADMAPVPMQFCEGEAPISASRSCNTGDCPAACTCSDSECPLTEEFLLGQSAVLVNTSCGEGQIAEVSDIFAALSASDVGYGNGSRVSVCTRIPGSFNCLDKGSVENITCWNSVPGEVMNAGSRALEVIATCVDGFSCDLRYGTVSSCRGVQYQWDFGPWSSCMVNCTRTRVAVCNDGRMNVPASLCVTVPKVEEPCTGGECAGAASLLVHFWLIVMFTFVSTTLFMG